MKASLQRIWAVFIKEFIQFFRDKVTFITAISIPLIQLILYGYAINTDVKHQSTVVYDQSRSVMSRDILYKFQNSQYFDIKKFVNSSDAVGRAIDNGQAKVGIIIPPKLESNILGNKSSQILVIIDASDPMSSSSALSASQMIGLLENQEILTKKLQQNGIILPSKTPFEVDVRAWYNPDLLSTYFLVPGLIAVLISLSTLVLTAMAIVREKERGTYEQLIITPLRPIELTIGKVTPYAIIGYAQMTLVIIAAVVLFKLNIKGNLLLLYIFALPFILANLSLGYIISTLAKNQQQALQMSFFLMVPIFLLSGFMFPREAMPGIVYYLSYIAPATFFLVIVRGIILKGLGFYELVKWEIGLIIYIIIALNISRFLLKRKS
ncbi:ABC-2 type transport system permease protein [Thermodesulfobium acidiphilum]|uniref:ABC-2 type transport system permease protein n=1 Tax=Thermodesulfobium acidiphilum TaxID=1794699 RepID=A0A2R4W2H5_THEAF|nr:ABC transporter permease [Thermodesulfobium acidiphilum]AWB10862.1 ABC-2 type transport system permease protein [Thermodesulfobium acidiphilum]